MQAVAVVTLLVLLLAGGVAYSAVRIQERKFLLIVGGTALLLRVVVAVGLLAVAPADARVFPDERTYMNEATAIAEGGELTNHGYSNVLGRVFTFTDPSLLLARGINVIAGALVAVLVFQLTEQITGRTRPAMIAGLGVAVWPSLVVWSGLVLKDTLTILLLLVGLMFGMRAFRGKWASVPGAAIALGGVVMLRQWAFVVFGLAILVAFVVRAILHRGKGILPAFALLITVGIIGWISPVGFLGIDYTDSAADIGRISAVRGTGSVGETGFGVQTDDFGDVLKGVPRGFLFGILGPFPWDAGPTEAKAILFLELPIWYATLILALVGVKNVGWRSLLDRWGLPLAFACGIVLVIVTFEGNAGTAFRHRSMAIPISIMLASVSLGSSKMRSTWLDKLHGWATPGDQVAIS